MMHKSNEDCFYFLTSSCAKGVSCTYRHSPLALSCNVVCPSWLRGNCRDPACPFRHTTAQRPIASNGILCFYENTPMGCLKPDCTFVHSRPRMNARNPPPVRPSTTSLITKDLPKSVVSNTLTDAARSSTSSIDTTQPTINETPIASTPNLDTPSPIVKSEITVRRIAIPSIAEQSNATTHLSENKTDSLSTVKSATRSVIADSPKLIQEETTQPRLVVNRNVVITESTSDASRKMILTTPTLSNRVVLSSDTVSLSSKVKKNTTDTIEQENRSKKFKSDSRSTVDSSRSNAKQSVTNRLSPTSSQETASTNGSATIRLNRDRLPASGTSSTAKAKPSNEEKTSAGTGLRQDNERRTMRIERFQTKTISPPRSIVRSSSSIRSEIKPTTDSSTIQPVKTSSSNDRKRTAPETTMKDTPKHKRMSTSSSSLTRDQSWEKQTDRSIAKTSHRTDSSTTVVPPQSAHPSPVRARFTPQPIVPPPPLEKTEPSRLRQPPSVVIKRPLATAPSQSTSTPPENSISSKSTIDHSTLNTEDENQLLKIDHSADVVDTFALIDEALLEADNLLELM